MTDRLFQNPERIEQEQLEAEKMQRNNSVNLKALLMTLAIVIAPFLALVFSLEVALAVLAIALGFTTWLTWHVARELGPIAGSRLRVMGWLNLVIMVVVLLILLGLIIS